MTDYIIAGPMTEKMATAAISQMVNPIGIVQGEWDLTLQRLRACCTVVYATTLVDLRRNPIVEISADPTVDLSAVEGILFENLLLAPLHRVARGRTIAFQCEWLWSWRKAVPGKVEPLGPMCRLAPDTPRAMFTYRYNVLEVG